MMIASLIIRVPALTPALARRGYSKLGGVVKGRRSRGTPHLGASWRTTGIPGSGIKC